MLAFGNLAGYHFVYSCRKDWVFTSILAFTSKKDITLAFCILSRNVVGESALAANYCIWFRIASAAGGSVLCWTLEFCRSLMNCQIQSDVGGDTPNPKHINEDFETSKSSKGNPKRAADFDAEDGRNYSTGIHLNELVIYDPGAKAPAVIPHMEKQTTSLENFLGTNSSGRNLSSIGVFTVQCALCFKWRIIPTKEKYEEIREHILEEPFICEQAHEWRPDISCEDPTDITQDGSRLWAIDKPNIARPPPGWERILRIRGEGGTKFADVYYAAPSGKRLRSMVEIQKYLHEHPELVEEGVNLTQFSFLKPRPLQENYVRKRLPTLPNSCDESGLAFLRPLEPDEVDPLSWVTPTFTEH